jgi:hypothetical protein
MIDKAERKFTIKELSVTKTLAFLTEVFFDKKGLSGADLIALHKKYKINNTTSSVCKKLQLFVSKSGLFFYHGFEPDRNTSIMVLEELRKTTTSNTIYHPTQREYFAGLAMQGLLANLSQIRRDGFKDNEISEFARIQADALISELNK